VIVGGVLLTLGLDSGLYWAAVGVMGSLATGGWNAWILLRSRSYGNERPFAYRDGCSTSTGAAIASACRNRVGVAVEKEKPRTRRGQV
jgi:hypothetical protein